MWFLILLLLCSTANADVYVVTNSDGSVYDMSNQPDAIVPAGYTRTILKKQDIKDLPIVGSPQLYTFKNGAFNLNTSAVQAQQAAQTQAIAVQTTRQAARASAIAKLKTLGLTDEELKAIGNE